jgi:protein-disulfide isomerase
MKILQKVVFIFLILGLGYTTYGVIHFHWMYHRAENPKKEFQVLDNPDGNITLVEYLNYSCGFCKDIHPVLKETMAVRKDVRYVVRPLAYGNPDEDTVRSVKLAFAAGLQGKFLEFHEAFLEYPEPDFPDDFIRELCDLYGLDYDQLIQDSEGKEVQKIVDRNLAISNHATIFSVPSIMIGKNIYMPPDEGIPNLQEMLTIIETAERE